MVDLASTGPEWYAHRVTAQKQSEQHVLTDTDGLLLDMLSVLRKITTTTTTISITEHNKIK